ncbi:TPA: negative regulator of sigma-Y activity [Listeria monocytogenes]|nr:negative regulator of sigma-Y activity [Listeria monocytogenes]HAK1548948.1 negative regulator of sigma-Y activity [Listeria monocytogenes]
MDKTQIALIIPVILLYLALLLTAIIDLTKNWNERKNPVIWLVVIIVINIFGPIAYFIFGPIAYFIFGRKEEGN